MVGPNKILSQKNFQVQIISRPKTGQEKLKEMLGFILNTKVLNEKLGIMPTSKVRKLK